MANRSPFIGSGRFQESGALATRKQDFNAHYQGNGFRHDATNIDMNPIISSLGGATVQEALENVRGLITSAGSGFLSIGDVDGYVQGNYNVGDPATPTLVDAFAAAIADDRLVNGGIILMLSGRYHLRQTVTIPAGVSVIGEISGTTIIGEMQEEPMFVIEKPSTSVQLTTGVNVDRGSNIGCVRFMNLILADNLDGYLLFGEPTMVSVPMIEMEADSHLVCENVTFIGKIHSGSTPRNKTLAAISCSSSGTDGTVLTLERCYLDGFRSGILFTPEAEEKDLLTVNGCKIRIYGTENVASQSVALNSFFVISHCNLSITNNYLVGAGTYVNTVVNVTDGTGTNTKGIISGNIGNPYSTSSGKIIVNSTSSTHVCAVVNNNWGTSVDSGWYIIVGSGSGTSPVGDFNGPTAINTILSIANSISSFAATVIVNPGTYTVSGVNGGNFANLRFVGNKHGKEYPTFTLSLSTGTDSLGNRAIALGNRLESIRFVSSGVRHSVRPGFSTTALTTQSAGGLLEVLDCVFINTALYALDLGSSSWTDSSGNEFSTRVDVKNCHFLQDGTFSDTISLVLPRADQVKVENCYFTGNGYAISIGSNGYTALNGSSISNVVLSDVICDLTGYTITSHNTSLQKSYVLVEDVTILKIDNCQIYSDSSFASSTPIGSSLTANPATFSKFIHFNAQRVHIDDSVFVGPYHTFTTSSVTYALPAVFLEPELSARVKNSTFFGGTLPLQIGGTLLVDADLRERIVVENCHFNGEGNTALDLDIEAPSEDAFSQISIKGCNFRTVGGGYRILHTNTSSSYGGAVQVFAGDCFVSFTDNLLNTEIASNSFTTNTAALMIDNIGSSVNTAVVSNNTFYTLNEYTSGNSDESATTIFCRSSVQMIQNNFISMYNTATPSASFIGCLWIDNPGTGDYSDALVSNNIFARRNYAGLTGNLFGGYIYISDTSSNYRGRIIDNSFDSLTTNGSGTGLVFDSINFPDNWTVERNKNQTQSKAISWVVGNKGIAAGSNLGNNILYGGVAADSNIYNIAGSNLLIYNYQDTSDQIEFRWSIPLQSILPPNVYVTAVSYKYQATAVPATLGSISARLNGVDGNNSDSTSISGTSAVTRNFSLTHNYTTKSNDSLSLVITASINHSSTMTVTISEVTITYHW